MKRPKLTWIKEEDGVHYTDGTGFEAQRIGEINGPEASYWILNYYGDQLDRFASLAECKEQAKIVYADQEEPFAAY